MSIDSIENLKNKGVGENLSILICWNQLTFIEKQDLTLIQLKSFLKSISKNSHENEYLETMSLIKGKSETLKDWVWLQKHYEYDEDVHTIIINKALTLKDWIYVYDNCLTNYEYPAFYPINIWFRMIDVSKSLEDYLYLWQNHLTDERSYELWSLIEQNVKTFDECLNVQKITSEKGDAQKILELLRRFAAKEDLF